MKYDVAVIGAGPAGSASVAKLAQAGAKVLWLERQAVPRHKACGGAMPSAITPLYESIGRDISKQLDHRVSRFRSAYNYSPFAPSVEISEPILMVRRAAFDAHAIEHAIRCGDVDFRPLCSVLNLERETSHVRLKLVQGESINAPFAIVANGARSNLVKTVGLRASATTGLAIDAELEVDDSLLEKHFDVVSFNFCCIESGYGWVFPKSDGLSCGIGGWYNPRKLGATLRTFLHNTIPSESVHKLTRRGHPIPIYSGVTPLTCGRVCVVGDAASLVDPIMGEGIRYAVKSGILAAESVLAADTSNGQLDYESRLDTHIRPLLNTLCHLAAPDYRDAPEWFYDQFLRQGLTHEIFYSALAAQQFKRKRRT